MNTHIRRVGIVMFIMFGLLLANVSYTVVARHDELRSHPRNSRVMFDQNGRERGPIMVGNLSIARSIPNPVDDGYAFQRVYSPSTNAEQQSTQASIYSHITGYQSVILGKTGLEQEYAQELVGSSDSLAISRVGDMILGRKTSSGASLETTLDSRLQAAAWQALGNSTGAIVVLDTSSGAVRALVSKPGFDPNELAAHKAAEVRAAAARLEKDPARPLFDRARRELYFPGSSFKLVTTAALLADGKKGTSAVDTPITYTYPGSTAQLGSQDRRCNPTQTKTLARALELSCNTTFAKAAVELGQDKLAEQARKFGFGTSFLNSSASRFPENLSDADLAKSAIGQFEVQASALQMAMVAAAIANDGVVMKPYLVESVRDSRLQEVSRHTPEEFGRALTSGNAKELRDMMVGVTTNGSGDKVNIPGRRVGSKTGTAETAPGKAPYSWFVAFVEGSPSLSVAVMVEKPVGYSADAVAHGGYSVASPMARAVLDAALS